MSGLVDPTEQNRRTIRANLKILKFISFLCALMPWWHKTSNGGISCKQERSTSNEKPVSNKQKAESRNEQPATRNKQPEVRGQRSVSSKQKAVSCKQQPATSNQRSGVSHKHKSRLSSPAKFCFIFMEQSVY